MKQTGYGRQVRYIIQFLWNDRNGEKDSVTHTDINRAMSDIQLLIDDPAYTFVKMTAEVNEYPIYEG